MKADISPSNGDEEDQIILSKSGRTGASETEQLPVRFLFLKIFKIFCRSMSQNPLFTRYIYRRAAHQGESGTYPLPDIDIDQIMIGNLNHMKKEKAEAEIKKNTKLMERIHDLYALYIYRLALKFLGDDESAAECVQLSYMRILVYLERLDHMGDIESPQAKSYIYTIVHSSAMDMLRERGKGVSVPDDELRMAADARVFAAERERVNAERSYYELFEVLERSLSRDERLMIEMRYADGYTFAEVAEHFGMSEAACRKRIERIKKKAVDAAVKKGLIKR